MRKKIKDYENYFIYDNGDVFNSITNKILKGTIGEHGYKYYRLSKNGMKKMFLAHRLVAEAFLDNIEHLPVVNHKDGNKLNNDVRNLEWTTYSENAKHAHNNKLISTKRKREYYTEDLKNEKWKKILNFHYSISSEGRVRNDANLLLLKASKVCGYLKVRLSNCGTTKEFLVHKLVYCLFNDCDNVPNGYVIDHIDGNKTNNSLKNLRLITLSENVKQAMYNQNLNNSCKKVKQLNLDGQLINIFPSCAEAARKLNLDSSTISKVCRGINKTHGGFIFQYVE